MGRYFLIIFGLILVGIGAWYYFTERPYTDFSFNQLFLTGGTISVFSDDFTDGTGIPQRFTCDGINVSPSFSLQRIPQNTKSLAILMTDESLSPTPFTHWIEFNINPNLTRIDSSKVLGGATVGVNDFGNSEYDGPCPPEKSTHKYYFKVFALDSTLSDQNFNRAQIEEAMKGHIIASGYISGVYSRNP